MSRLMRPLLLAAVLLFSQHAAMLHGLAHAQHELALATQPEGKAPALDHGIDVCAAFGAFAHALNNAGAAPVPAGAPVGGHAAKFAEISIATRSIFDSRAPPFSA